MSRCRPRYREYTQTDIGVCPDIAISDIVSSRHDIVSFFPISDPILVISAPISGQYRDIPVPCQTRYRVFHRYRARYGPDIANNIIIYECRVQKSTTSSPMCLQYTDIGYFPISGRLHDVRDDISPAASAPPPPAARTGQALRLVQPPNLPRRSNLNRHAAL